MEEAEEDEADTIVFTDTILLNILKWLKLIDLVQCSMVNSSWKRIAYDCTLWRRIDLRRHREYLNDNRLTRLLRDRCPLLYSLDLSNARITPIICSTLKKYCPRLKALLLQKCIFEGFKKYNAEIEDFPETLEMLNLRHVVNHTVLRSISNKLHKLKNFAFTNSFMINISEWDFFPIIKNIKVLDISHCSAAEDDLFGYIAESCPEIQSLAIRHCSNVFGDDLHEVIENCKQLRSLTIVGTNIDDESLSFCDWGKSRLEELEISWCKSLTSLGLCEVLSKRSHLKYLRLCSCMFGGAIDSAVLKAMYFRQPLLEILDISYAQTIDNGDIAQLVETLPSLKMLRLSSCLNLDSGVLSLIPNRVKVFSTFHTETKNTLMTARLGQIRQRRLIRNGNSYMASPYPEVSSTENCKKFSFNKIIEKYR